MRVAIVKQLLDAFGPWSSIRWRDTTPKGILQLWPGKGAYWELTTQLGADWWIVPQQIYTDYTYDSVLSSSGRSEILGKYTTGVVAPEELPLDEYDLVIALDPVLRFPENARTLFAYFASEHWDRRYRRSLRRPLNNADVFLDHMLEAPARISRLPQAAAFPYVRDPRTMRSLFAAPERTEAAWVDWRTLAALTGSPHSCGVEAVQLAAARLQQVLGLRVTFRAFAKGLYQGEDPPRWGDAANYFRQVGRQKYYICLGRASGPGQGLADAGSLGCICLGEQDKSYHRLICHPEALCGDLQDLPRRFRRICASPQLQLEILAWQDDQLRRHFVEEPLELLDYALRLKRSMMRSATRFTAPAPESAERAAP